MWTDFAVTSLLYDETSVGEFVMAICAIFIHEYILFSRFGSTWMYFFESVYFYVCIKKRLCIQTTHTALISRCFLCAVFLLRGFLECLQRSRAIKAKCIMNERKTYLPTVMASVQTLMSKLRSLQWRYNGHDGISNYHPYHCLLNRLFSGRTSKLRVTGLCEENSPVTGEFPTQRASNTENISIGWRHHVITGVIANLRYYC